MIRFIAIFVSVVIIGVATGFGLYVWQVQTMLPYRGQAEGIVVLTGGDNRVETGMKLLASRRADYLLISGVHASVDIDDLLRINRQEMALAKKITLGFTAVNTASNAEETAEWVTGKKIHSLIIVTSHYHMPRAMLHLGAHLPEVTFYPYPVRPDLFAGEWWQKREAWRLLMSDYYKLLLTYPQIYFFYHE